MTDYTKGQTPPTIQQLISAIERKAPLKTIKTLIKNIKNINEITKNADNREKTALSTALDHNHTKIATLLINAGADIKQELVKVGCAGNDKNLNILIKSLSKSNIPKKQRRDLLGDTFLYAYRNGYERIMETLIRAGANIDYQNWECDDKDCFEDILTFDDEQEADDFEGNSENNSCGNNALLDSAQEALYYKEDKTYLMILILEGANPNVKNCSGNTPLHYTVSNGKYLETKYLLEAGADVNAKNISGNTPLIEAVRLKSFDKFNIIKLLLNHHALLEEKNIWNRTVLDYIDETHRNASGEGLTEIEQITILTEKYLKKHHLHQKTQLFLKLFKLIPHLEILSITILFKKLLNNNTTTFHISPCLSFNDQYNLTTYLKQSQISSVIIPNINKFVKFQKYLSTLSN